MPERAKPNTHAPKTTDLLPLTAPVARAATTPTAIIVATPIACVRRVTLAK